MSDSDRGAVDGDLADDLVFTIWFAHGRPDAAALRTMCGAAQISALVDGDGSRAGGGSGHDGGSGAVVLIGDCRFAVEGLAPGPAVAPAIPSNLFDISDSDLARAQAIRLTVQNSASDAMPVVDLIRHAVQLVLAMSEEGDCLAVGWAAADSAMGVGYFRKVARDWLAGGPFPALGLVSLVLQPDESLISRGLAALIGQELAIPAMSGLVGADRARIAIRMIDHLVTAGPVTSPETVEIEKFGEFQIAPGPTGKFIYLK